MNTALEPYQSGLFDLAHTLTVEKHAHTALLTLNHPPANTWERASLIGLRQLIEHLDRDDSIRALVLTGQGTRFFSAGLDLHALARTDFQHAHTLTRLLGEAFEALSRFRGLSIAAINGHALGAGLECALACDLRIASEQALFGLPETGIGLLPCAGGLRRLPARVGEGWAKRMILCGERIDCNTALRIGLIEQQVDSSQLRGSALLLAARAAQQSPAALQACKQLIEAAREQRPDSGPSAERERFAELLQHPDGQEGIRAFLEERQPRWSTD